MAVWNHCIQNKKIGSEVKARIVGAKNQMEKFQFFFGLKLGFCLFSHNNNLSRTLQAKRMSAISSRQAAELVLSVLMGLRNDESFNAFYAVIIKDAKSFRFIEGEVLPRKRKTPNYSIVQYIEGYQSKDTPHHPETVQDRYRVIYFEALDSIISATNGRFHQPCFEVYKKMESVLLKSIKSEDATEEIRYLRERYNGEIDFDAFVAIEIDIIKTLYESLNPICFNDILDHCKSLPSSTVALIPNTVIILKLLLVNPTTSATSRKIFLVSQKSKDLA